jgi:hypothetical protein
MNFVQNGFNLMILLGSGSILSLSQDTMSDRKQQRHSHEDATHIGPQRVDIPYFIHGGNQLATSVGTRTSTF